MDDNHVLYDQLYIYTDVYEFDNFKMEESKSHSNRIHTFTVELESIERMLMQIELTVMAGDHESYSISA